MNKLEHAFLTRVSLSGFNQISGSIINLLQTIRQSKACGQSSGVFFYSAKRDTFDIEYINYTLETH